MSSLSQLDENPTSSIPVLVSSSCKNKSKVWLTCEAILLLLQYAEIRAMLWLQTMMGVWLLSIILYWYGMFSYSLSLHLLACAVWLLTGLAITKWISLGNDRGDVADLMKTSNLQNKVVVVTGPASGLGRETVVDFAKLGATVVFAARGGEERCGKIIHKIKQEVASCSSSLFPFAPSSRIVYIPVDLSSLASVREFVRLFRAQFDRIDVLVCNAGINPAKHQLTGDGLELHMGTNHFGHFLMCSMLEDILQKSKARVIQLGSMAEHFACWGVGYEYWGDPANYDQTCVYGHSKLFCDLTAIALNERLSLSGGSAYSVHPGIVITHLNPYITDGTNYWATWLRWLLCKSASRGAKTVLHCALSPTAVPGGYHADCGVVRRITAANDIETARSLWKFSETICSKKI